MRICILLLWLALGLAAPAGAETSTNARALEPGAVIAFVGGEDMVRAAECGYLEYLLVRARPENHPRFHSLAWEGDTVFEQRRDLNYPSLRQQLDTIGATVVLAQFGQMEVIDAGVTQGETLFEADAGFETAYSRLLSRLGAGGEGSKRSFVLLAPTPPEAPRLLNTVDASMVKATAAIAHLAASLPNQVTIRNLSFENRHGYTRDGVHLNDSGQAAAARSIALGLLGEPPNAETANLPPKTEDEKRLLDLIVEKNRLWFRYYRPQNWAFLAGDRTEQPSSRDD
ncbi:MAG TPA: hypothetical protein VGH90_08235, partial [Chthoniobacteraceae bacterium]